MTNATSPAIPLFDLPVGTPARITGIRGGGPLTRRLLGLGLRLGGEVVVLHHRGRAVVLSVGGRRVALGGGVVEKLLVQPLVSGPTEAD